jgi:NNP family nitrate/nitrite transporter-like MFS transporter
MTKPSPDDQTLTYLVTPCTLSSFHRRTVCIVPAAITMLTGVMLYFVSEDSPKGNYSELKKRGSMPEVSAAASFRSGAINVNSWLLFAQYACCFGVELTMYNAAALYFTDQFGQTTEQAAAIASIFGWMNLFARGFGGYFSDKACEKVGMRGRLIVQSLLLAVEGALVLVFAHTKSLAGSIVVMTAFSFLVQAANGSTFGIVPYVDPASTGSIAGIVGAGGNVGAVCFGLGFRQLGYKQAYSIMGSCILISSTFSAFICIKGHRGLLFGTDDVQASKSTTLAIPEKDPDATEEVNA